MRGPCPAPPPPPPPYQQGASRVRQEVFPADSSAPAERFPSSPIAMRSPASPLARSLAGDSLDSSVSFQSPRPFARLLSFHRWFFSLPVPSHSPDHESKSHPINFLICIQLLTFDFQLSTSFSRLSPATRIKRDATMTEQKKPRRQMLEEFVAKKPDDAFSRYGLAMECMNSGDPPAADAHLRPLLDPSAAYLPAY